MSEQKIKIGITQGDTNGIGCEIIIKALSDSRICDMFTPIIYGSSKAFGHYKRTISELERFSINIITSVKDAHPKKINLINVCNDELRIEAGVATSDSGSAALAALEAASAALEAGEIDAVVTAPICKENIQSEIFSFNGHTEYFASKFGGTPLMMMCSEAITLGLVTTHVALKEVSKTITTQTIVDKLGELRNALRENFMIVEPKIAVMSINPHAGDGGLMGNEDDTTVKPAIAQAFEKGILAFGPFAADGFFAAAGYSKYDAILPMYHDQGLIPFKTLAHDGVNFTAGLPIVRTSPAHGVGFDIAGKDMADPSSMRNAIYAALDILRSRQQYKKMHANPLRRFKRDYGADVSVKDLPEEGSN